MHYDAGMSEDFLAQLMDNASRARVLRVFVFSPSEPFTLAHAAKRAGISAQTAAREIKALEQLGILKEGKLAITLANKTKKTLQGRQKEHVWIFDGDFKHARAISQFVHEISPVQYGNIMNALKGSGRLVAVILSGSFMGDPTRPADIIIAVDALHESRLEKAIKTLEPQFGREIRYAAFSTPEFRYRLTVQDRLIRDTLDYPHLVLLDKARLL